MIGLLKAVERFDPEHGSSFSSFATPTILGELRRYFRDYTWAVRVPRQLQERVLAMSGVVGTLTQRFGRSPSPKEIADETGLTEEEVLEALEADGAYGTTPLEPASDSGFRPDASARLADAPEDRTDQVVERRLLAASLVGQLSEREQEIVELRFAKSLTQSEIAERIGVSQMQVSRSAHARPRQDAPGARRSRSRALTRRRRSGVGRAVEPLREAREVEHAFGVPRHVPELERGARARAPRWTARRARAGPTSR